MTPETVDIVVVGAGPAGLAAACELRRLGMPGVVVLDREPQAGGVPRHCGHPPFGLREFGRLLTGPSYARLLVGMAEAAGVDIRTSTTVVSIEARGDRQLLTLSTGDGISILLARRVLLATGTRERPRAARFASGGRPLGILNTGALQAYAHIEHRSPFRRPVIVGTELVALSAILTCRSVGARPVAMIEENAGVTAHAALFAYPSLLGIPVLKQTRIVDIKGDTRVTGVTVECSGSLRDIDCDGVIFTGQFVPEAHLARNLGLDLCPGTGGPVVDQFGRTSNGAIFAAGNLLRPVETAGWSFREGRSMAGFIARDLGGDLPGTQGTVPIQIEAPLRYCMPQRLVPGAAGMARLQLRVGRAVAGEMVATDSLGTVLCRSTLASRPERRITLPLAALAAAHGPITIGIPSERN
nr:FAD/NAD(P)-binding oxidoreductase [uncultured Gellertiella sp.]